MLAQCTAQGASFVDPRHDLVDISLDIRVAPDLSKSRNSLVTSIQVYVGLVDQKEMRAQLSVNGQYVVHLGSEIGVRLVTHGSVNGQSVRALS